MPAADREALRAIGAALLVTAAVLIVAAVETFAGWAAALLVGGFFCGVAGLSLYVNSRD